MELLSVFALLFGAVTALSWYYIATVIFVLLFATAFANDEIVGSETFLFLGILGVMSYVLWGQISIIEAVLAVVYYLVIGSIWSIANYAITIRKYMMRSKADGELKRVIKYYQNKITKARIARWVLYFPFSIFEYVIGQFFVNIIKRIVNMLGGTYDRIANHYYNKFFE